MKRIVKGKIEKFYCDECGKNLYDRVPKTPTVKLFGEWIPEMGLRKHCEYVSIRKISKQGDWCKECYEKLTVQ